MTFCIMLFMMTMELVNWEDSFHFWAGYLGLISAEVIYSHEGVILLRSMSSS